MTENNHIDSDDDIKEGEYLPNIGGRPSLYSPDKGKEVYELMKQGKTNAMICASLDISTSTFYNWRNNHDEFREWYERGEPHRTALFESVMIKGARGEIPNFNATAQAMVMNNVCDNWAREKKEDRGQLQINIEKLEVVESFSKLDKDQLLRRIETLQRQIEEDDK